MSSLRAQAVVVVDASVAIEFLGDDPSWTRRWIDWATAETMLVSPPHFPAEAANGLMRSVRLTAREAAARLHRLYQTGIELTDRGEQGLVEAMDLAERHRLTVYDALYLQLAIDVDGELATLDQELRLAALAEQVSVAG